MAPRPAIWTALAWLASAAASGAAWAAPVGDGWSDPGAQRLFYVHVPLAWVTFLAYGILAYHSARVLAGRPDHDARAGAAAEVGVLFAVLALSTGSLWARAEWGVFWRWGDPKLLATFALALVLLAVFASRSGPVQSPPRSRGTAAFALAAAAVVPATYLASRLGGSAHPSIGGIAPTSAAILLASIAAWSALALALIQWRSELFRRGAVADVGWTGAGSAFFAMGGAIALGGTAAYGLWLYRIESRAPPVGSSSHRRG